MIHTLDSVVKEYLIETGDTQLNRYARFYQIAVSGLREFNLNSSGVSKAVELPIKANDTVDLPEDYIQYTVIGLMGSDGKIHTLGRNDSLSKVQGLDDCGGTTSLTTSAEGNATFQYGLWQRDFTTSYRNGEFMGKLFGVSGGINPIGEYRVDTDNGIIILTDLNSRTSNTQRGAAANNPTTNSIVLEYLADINLISGDYRVHPFMIESLKTWIHWKAIQRDRNRSRGEKADAKVDYFNAARWSKKRFTSSTLNEWTAAFRSGNTASVKF